MKQEDKTMRDKVKRFISILMTALMLVNLLPVGALADGITSIGYQQATVDNNSQTVYVYVKVKGNISGLDQNKDHWYTIGTVTIPNMPDPSNYKGSNNGEHVDSVELTNNKGRLSVNDVKGNISHTKNTTIPLDKATWTGTVDGQSFGFVRVNSGATGYVGGGWTWHLDGYVDVNRCKVTYKPGEYGAFEAKTYDAKHGDATPAFGGETTGKPGWKFDGWEPEVADTVTGNATYTAVFVPDENQTATVLCTIDEKQIGYGTVYPSIYQTILQATGKLKGGKPISGSMATANAGYKFVGWYKVTGEETYEWVTGDPDLKQGVAESKLNRDEKTDLYQNTVFVARFEPDEKQTATVTYTAENGTVTHASDTILQADASGLTGSKATVNKGYKFDGWYKGDERITTDLTLTPEMAKDNLDKDENGLYVNTTFTAKCVPDENQHATVIYTIDETQRGYGSVVPSIIEIILQATGKLANGDPISGSTATAKPGYKFVGWYKVTGWTTEWQTEWITDSPELTPEVAEQNLTQNEQGLYQNTVFAAKFELNDYAYTVEHYWIGDKDNPDAQPFHTDADESQTAPYGSTVKYAENGASWVIMTNPVYTFAKADPEKITISADASQNVLKLYYYKNVKLIANSETNPYNGEEQHVFGYTCAVAEKQQDGSVEYVPWTGEKPLTFEGISASGLGKDVNENGYPVTFNDTPIGENNGLYYVSESQTGTLTITPAPVTLQAPIASKTYDGTPLKAEDYGHSFVEGLDFADDFASISVEGSQTQAGSSVSQIKEVVPKKGKDLKNYKLTFLPGTLTVTKRSVLLTSQSATKTYDGSALTRPAVTITGDGFVPGELAKVEATGSITNVGSTPNAIQYTTTGAFNPANYSIALSVGTLTVTAKPEPEPRRTFNLTVNYVYQNGKRAAASYNRGGLKNGETFDITSPVIAGYTASETVVSGTIDNRDIKVTVIYTADGVNLDDYGVPLGLGNITMNVGDCFE